MVRQSTALKLLDGGVNGNMTAPDLFAGEDKAYSVEKFYTRSTDGNGNSETKYLKMSGPLLAGIGQLISTNAIPAYRSDADFIRDAVLHRLKYINEKIKNGDIESIVNRTIILAHVQAKQMEVAEYTAIIASYEETMQSCVEVEDWILLDELIDAAQNDYEELRPAYKARMDRVLDKYKGELKRGKGIGK